MSLSQEAAFPQLTTAELAVLKPLATVHDYVDDEIVFRAGQPDIDLFVVETGQIDILNPTDGKPIVTHEPGQFSGDIDLLTGRPVLVTGVASKPIISYLGRVPGSHLRTLLNQVPSFGEKLMVAFTRRRELLSQLGTIGLRVFGPTRCRATNTVREFLYKNFVPFRWFDPETDEGQKVFKELGSPRKSPVIECEDGQILVNPSLQELASAAGIWRHCPGQDVDFAIVGAGPAGLAAAVYAASEGLSTLVLDRLGPGGQAGGSSRIENFIGFSGRPDRRRVRHPRRLADARVSVRGWSPRSKSRSWSRQRLQPIAMSFIWIARGDTLSCHSARTRRQLARLEANGADRFTGAGIYYACTTVEADLYDGADVAVVGAGNSAGQAVMFLAECCPTRTVHLLIRRTLGPSMSDYLVNRIRATRNVVVHEQTVIDTVNGGRHIEEVILKSQADAEPRRLPCSAVFVFIGAEPAAQWLPSEIGRDADGYLLAGTDTIRSGLWPRPDRDPCPLETTIPGVLAAGDIRSGSTKRVGFAVGDGSLAVTCAHRLLSIDP